jgi:hypothetical protein
MATPLEPSGEFEFSDSQNQLIGSLARKMTTVGFVMVFFGILQIVNAVMTMFFTRDPNRVIAAAEKAGMPAEQLDTLREALSGGFWSSPVAISAISVGVAGLLLFLVGNWTRQAGLGFAGIVLTKGRDVSRLMDALGALHRKYALMYTILVVAAIFAFVSLILAFWQGWRGAG